MHRLFIPAAAYMGRIDLNLRVYVFIGTVLLHLFAAVRARRLSNPELSQPIPGIYIPTPSPFPDLEAFIDESSNFYNVDLFKCLPSPKAEKPVESVGPSLTVNGHAAGTLDAPPPAPAGKAKGGEGMRQALQVYKDKCPEMRAILIGTRRSDPHGGKEARNKIDGVYKSLLSM